MWDSCCLGYELPFLLSNWLIPKEEIKKEIDSYGP
jgi:hypothetical protein